MPENRKLALRILYTINSSPQYILARSASAVQVHSVPSSSCHNLQVVSADHPIQYATASLKTCLDVICHSSPELVQNGARDCAVYVLDPLEANSTLPTAPILSSQVTQREPSANVSRGVAVGLGLMSRGLGSEGDRVCVPGTLIAIGPGQDALEIVLALREIIPTTAVSSSKPEWGFRHKRARVEPTPVASTSTNVGVPMQIPEPTYSDVDKITLSKTTTSIHLSSDSKQHGMKSRFPRNLEAEKILGVSDTYVGPLKRKGRPKANEAAEDITACYRTNRAGGPGQSFGQRDSLRSGYSPGVFSSANAPTKNKHQAPSDANGSGPSPLTSHNIGPNSIVLGLRALLDNPTSSSTSNTSNTSLLALLSAVDTPTNPCVQNEPNPALLDALKQLLSTLSQSSQPPGDLGPNPEKQPPEDDPDIVLLDKENVDPTNFRRRKERNRQGTTKTFGTTPQPNAPEPGARVTHNSNRYLRSNENQAPHNNSGRKRTLSDLMDEKEAVRKLRKERGESGQQRKGTLGSTDSSLGGLRHYTHSVRYDGHSRERTTTTTTASYYRTAGEPWSSPVRQRVVSSPGNPIEILESPKAPKTSASSPARSTTIPSQSSRPYVLPEWARTDTSTQPRLSDRVQRALEEDEEKGKQDITRRKPIGNERAKGKTKRATKKPTVTRGSHKLMATPPPPRVSTSAPFKPPQPVAASDCSLFPSSSTVNDETMTVVFPPPTDPCTPPRKRQPSYAGTSLFTPTPSSWSGLDGLTSSPLFSPPQISDSPTRGKTSPICSAAMKQILLMEANGDVEESDDETLAQELDSALEDLDLIPNSLPLVNSETRDASRTSTSVHGHHSYPSNDEPSPSEDPAPQRQHWSGLPPSSPPPQSSPLDVPQELPAYESGLSTEDDDDDDVELPIATSDADPANNMEDILNSENTSTFFPEDPTVYLDNPEFQSLFLPLPGSSPPKTDETFSMDIFQQFTNHDLQSDDPQSNDPSTLKASNPSLNAALQNGLGDFDFTEFWETFKPMAENDFSSKLDNLEQSLNVDDLEAILGPASDHTQLAESVQALFSGCLM
ncbi:hypothetical protein BD779DRAFT_1669410 [Infundibulicybe gibba]|nr:hypothetical protein BD779DRAFT_1669410 [Infundibulicybe gibba]